MSKKFFIRPFELKDSEDYANTLLKTWPHDSIEEARKDVIIAQQWVKEAGNELWVAATNDQAVGFILIKSEQEWGPDGERFDQDALLIDWFDVHPDFQRQGVGTRLLKQAEKRAIEKGISLIYAHTFVSNLPMLNFSSKQGFKFQAFITGPTDRYLLVKRLK